MRCCVLWRLQISPSALSACRKGGDGASMQIGRERASEPGAFSAHTGPGAGGAALGPPHDTQTSWGGGGRGSTEQEKKTRRRDNATLFFSGWVNATGRDNATLFFFRAGQRCWGMKRGAVASRTHIGRRARLSHLPQYAWGGATCYGRKLASCTAGPHACHLNRLRVMGADLWVMDCMAAADKDLVKVRQGVGGKLKACLP